MSKEIDIPGGKATLRDPKDLKVRHRKLIRAAFIAGGNAFAKLPLDLGEPPKPDAPDEEKKAYAEKAAKAMETVELTTAEAVKIMDMEDATILAFLESWTLSDPLPKTLEDVGDMNPDVYDAIAEATKVEGVAVAQEADFGPTNDKTRPTGDSSSSAGV